MNTSEGFMSTKRFIALAALAVLSLTACSWRRTPVPIVADVGSTALLVGSWSGEYFSTETGRRGSISFDLESEKDTAYCDVTMAPFVGNARVGPVIHSDVPVAPSQKAINEPLKIRFIRLGNQQISGTLEPYTDPDCGCTVTTTFVGSFATGNRIEGTYTTVGHGLHLPTRGQWSVKRQAVASTRE
jgi:hypothetical protein